MDETCPLCLYESPKARESRYPDVWKFPKVHHPTKKNKHVEVEWKWHHNHIQHLNKPIKRTNKQLELSKHVSVSGLRDLSSHLLYPSQTPEPGEQGCLWQFPHPLGPPYCASQVMLPQQTETDRKLIDPYYHQPLPVCESTVIIGTGCPLNGHLSGVMGGIVTM